MRGEGKHDDREDCHDEDRHHDDRHHEDEQA
jgi:hypothetical protein